MNSLKLAEWGLQPDAKLYTNKKKKSVNLRNLDVINKIHHYVILQMLLDFTIILQHPVAMCRPGFWYTRILAVYVKRWLVFSSLYYKELNILPVAAQHAIINCPKTYKAWGTHNISQIH
jgi:hypothetical protein